MLNRLPREFQPDDAADWRQEEAAGGFDIERLLAAARRRIWIVIVCCIAGGALGVAYLLVAIPKYTAVTEVMIDQRRLSALQDAYALDAVGPKTGGFESEVELIRSERVAGRVVDALGLTTDPSFNTPGTAPLDGIILALRNWLPLPDWFASEPVTEETLQRSRDSAIRTLRGNLSATRIGLSYVLQIRYTDDSAVEAARIANAYAEAYLSDQMESAYDATRRASEWLQARIQELEQGTQAADLAVQQFMVAHNLSDVASDAVSDQQLTGVNSQLIAARGSTAEAEARLQRVQSILDSGDMSAAVTETLQNPIITNLRSRYLEASKRRGELEPLLGRSHLQVVSLTNDMREYERMMFDELGRIAETYKSEYAIAKSREDALATNLAAALTGTSAEDAREITQLRELQRNAQTLRNLHQTYLQRYQEISQQESFPITDARVLNVAAVPGAPSEPQQFSVLRTYLIFGALLGAALAALAEYRDRVFRTGQQVRDELGLEFLGMLPLVGKAAQKKARRHRRRGNKADAEVDPERQIGDLAPISRHVLDQPLSGFAETLRAARVGADLTLGKKAGKIIGVTSVLPGEGKSTVAKNLASLLAHQGKRTLLIDADLRNPGLSREIAKNAEAGIVDAVVDGKALEELILYEGDTKLAILPAVVKRRSYSHTSDILASSGMRDLLEKASEQYDYIVVDLPPMGPVVDVRAVASQIDSFLFVVSWGSTARKLVRDTLRAAPAVYEKCLGVVLNKVDPNKLKYYESYGSMGYYYGRYSSYYRN